MGRDATARRRAGQTTGNSFGKKTRQIKREEMRRIQDARISRLVGQDGGSTDALSLMQDETFAFNNTLQDIGEITKMARGVERTLAKKQREEQEADERTLKDFSDTHTAEFVSSGFPSAATSSSSFRSIVSHLAAVPGPHRGVDHIALS